MSSPAIRTTCSGCLHGELNQLGHTDPGGCLYTEDLLEELLAEAVAPSVASEPVQEEAPAPQTVWLTQYELEDLVVWPSRGIGVPPELWAELCPEGAVWRSFSREELDAVLALPYQNPLAYGEGAQVACLHALRADNHQMGGTVPVTDEMWASLLETHGGE